MAGFQVESNETPIIVTQDGMMRPTLSYGFDTTAQALVMQLAFATDPNVVTLTDVGKNSGINTVTIYAAQGNYFNYNNIIDTVLVIDVSGWSGILMFNGSTWNVF